MMWNYGPGYTKNLSFSSILNFLNQMIDGGWMEAIHPSNPIHPPSHDPPPNIGLNLNFLGDIVASHGKFYQLNCIETLLRMTHIPGPYWSMGIGTQCFPRLIGWWTCPRLIPYQWVSSIKVFLFPPPFYLLHPPTLLVYLLGVLHQLASPFLDP